MTKRIVGFSGGIDSQAVAGWVLNRYDKQDVVIVNTDAGGNEHPMTTEHIAWYSENVHPVNTIPAIVADMWEGEDQPEKHGFQPTDVLTFPLMSTIKGRFPSRRAQFCTEKLKLRPVRRWVQAQFPDGDYEYYAGVRRDESERRKTTPFTEFDAFYDAYRHHPIADWTKRMCFDFIKSRGEQINPLYTLGFNRVGCAPCINSSKDDVLNWLRRFPEMIDKVRGWEQQVGRTYFAPIVPGMEINFIDDIVRWSQTSRGGRQVDLLRVVNDPPSCESQYGLCE
ncbi:MAG: phosphoadenosine phosphosulfate reductase family protein [Fimbriimonadaceae bacterium]|nr:phosphoadenosine phosphosulfate reductase family protein [Fimbriimonadaceae bacterium]